MLLPAVKVVLVEAQPRRAADGVAETVRLAGGGAVAPYYYLGQHWKAGVTDLPTITTRLGFGPDGWTGGAVPQVSTVEWAGDPATLAAYFWKSAAITIRVGPDGGTDPEFEAILTGKVTTATVPEDNLVLTLADPAADLYRPILTARFTGTGGIEGDSDVVGRTKRRTWGRRQNVEGRVLLAGHNIYEFGDPAYPWQAFDDVRDGGGSASSLTVLAWQGSIAATLTALQAATAPEGGGVAAPSIACVKWWTKPDKPLTAAVRGEIGTGYVETAPEIAQRILSARSSLTIANLSASAAIRGGAAGWHVGDENETIAQALDGLLGGVSLLWVLEDSGQIRLRPWAWGTSVTSLTSIKATRGNFYPPHRARSVGYQANDRVMNRGEIIEKLLLDAAADAAAALNAAEAALALAEDAASTADGKVELFFQPSPPAAAAYKDLWFDTDDGNKQFVNMGPGLFIGGVEVTIGGMSLDLPWVLAQDQGIGQALADAAGAQATADGKVTTFVTETPSDPAPVAEGVGDLWLKKWLGIVYRWDGAGWPEHSSLGSPAGTYVAGQEAAALVADAATAKTNAASALANANSALSQIGTITSDAVLDKSEKPEVVRQYGAIIDEQAGIDARATAYGITTEKTTYDNAVSALTSYLTGLSPAYNSYTQDTPISRGTFNGKFNDIYFARQALLNKIAEIAGTRANLSGVIGAGVLAALDTIDTPQINTNAVSNSGSVSVPALFDFSWAPVNTWTDVAISGFDAEVALPAIASGRVEIIVAMNAKRSGGNDDQVRIRVLRRRSGYADAVVEDEPYINLSDRYKMFTWPFMDNNIPADGTWSYQLQVYRLNDVGIVAEVKMSAKVLRK